MILRASGYTLGLLLLACTGRVEGPPPPSGSGFSRPIFRAISLDPYDSVALGRPLPATVPATRLSDTLLQLNPGVFSGAVTIAVHTTQAGRVTSLDFDYAPGTSFEKMVAEYTELFGAPAAGGLIGESGPHWRYWDDDRTRFEIVRRGGGSRELVQSRLIDIAAVEP